jgi:hypothetical protein
MKIRPTENYTIQNTPRHTTISLIIDAATIAGVDIGARRRVRGFMYVLSRNRRGQGAKQSWHSHS